MHISDLSPAQQGSLTTPLSDPRRKAEIQRLAQGVASEHFGQNAFQNGNSAIVDTARISDEAIEEISRSGKPEDMQRNDQLVSALQSAFALKAPDDATADPNSAQDPNAASAEQGKSEKKKEKKETHVWDPTCETGQIHEGRAVIGKITVTTEIKEVDAPNAGAKSSKSGSSRPQSGHGSGNAAAQSGRSVQGNGNAQATQPANKEEGESEKAPSKDQDDKAGAAMASNMQAKGLQAPEMESKKGGGSQAVGSSSETFEVRTRATGANQTMKVQSAGELKQDDTDFLRYFKKLDDAPTLNNSTLHSKSKGQDLEKTATDYAGEALKRGERPEEVESNVKRLKETTHDG